MHRRHGFALALLVLLLAPAASAASQVHVTYTGDAYAVTFAADAAALPPSVRVDGERAAASRVTEPAGDDDALYRAFLPASALTYEIDGRAFTLPAPPARDEPTRVVFVGDMGTDANASAVLDAILLAEPDLVLIGGDLSYANGNASVWNEWFELIEPLAANVPVMPAYGNHEDYCDDGAGGLHHCGPDANGWHAHFALPNGDKLYYAFDWGPLRFTVLDTEAYIVGGDGATDVDEQNAFAAGSLASADGRWNVAVFHRPVRTTNEKDGLDNADIREALTPLVASADLALAAHLHGYERSKPADGEPLYVTSGGGGRELYRDWGPEEPWLAKRASEHHFLVLDVTERAVEIRALRVDGSELDRVVLERAPSPTPTPPSATPPGTTTPPSTTRVTPPSAEGNVTESRETPGPGLLALLVVLVTLSRRQTKPRAPG